MNLQSYAGLANPFLAAALVFWIIFWKALALWRAAKYGQKYWFITILALNSLTLGIIEIIYLFYFAKERLSLKDLKNTNFLP